MSFSEYLDSLYLFVSGHPVPGHHPFTIPPPSLRIPSDSLPSSHPNPLPPFMYPMYLLLGLCPANPGPE